MAEKQTLQLAMGVQRARQLLSFAALLHARLAPIDSTGGELLPSGLVRLVCEVPRWSAATSEITVTAETSGVRCPHCEGPGWAVSLPRADCVLCDDCCWECRVAHAGMHTHCRGCKSVFCDGFQACAGCDESLLCGDAGASAISTQNCVTLIPFRSDETMSSCSDCNGLCSDCRPVQHDDTGAGVTKEKVRTQGLECLIGRATAAAAVTGAWDASRATAAQMLGRACASCVMSSTTRTACFHIERK